MIPGPWQALIGAFATVCLASGALAEALWIDVRSAEEYRADHIDGDPNMPFGEITERIESLAPERDREIVVYCGSGGRSAVAKLRLGRMGYTNVRNAGGIDDARRERNLD